MLSKTGLVAQREYVENIRTKAFWIGILVFPILISAMMVVPMLLERAKSARSYAVVDQSGWLLEAVEERATMPDVEKVLRRALKDLEDEKKAAELPETLRATAQQINVALSMIRSDKLAGDLDDEQWEDAQDKVITGFATMVGGFSGADGAAMREMLPAQALAELSRLRSSIQEWWLALPADEAAEYGSGLAKSRYSRVDVEVGGSQEDLIAELNRQVKEDEIFAYFVLPSDPVVASDGGRYVSTNLTDDDLRIWFSNIAGDVIRERRMEQREIDRETAQWITEDFRLKSTKIGSSGEEEDVLAQDLVRQWAPVVFVYLLWISVFTIAQMLLTNTIEEKSNRLMEVLLSSVSPIQLMMGKIVGIAMTGMTMLGSWMVFFYLVTKFLPRFIDADIPFDLSVIATDPKFMVSFLVYFLLGYLFYAALLVGIGSVCNSLKEAQNLQTPIMLLLFVPLASMMPIGKDPNGLLAQVMSFIPPFTPFVMMNRAAGPPSMMEYVLTTALLLVSVGVVMWAAAKVFRIGVLMTGKPPKLGEIIRWIRAPVGIVPERDQS